MGGFDLREKPEPDPTLKKKPEPDPTLKKKPGFGFDLFSSLNIELTLLSILTNKNTLKFTIVLG